MKKREKRERKEKPKVEKNEPNLEEKEEIPKEPLISSKDEKSSVKTYRPPDNSPPVVVIHTKPSLMKRLNDFLQHFDRPPQQLFLEFVFVEVEEDSAQQFRYKLNHPILNSIVGGEFTDDMRNLQPLQSLNRTTSTRLPNELNPRL